MSELIDEIRDIFPAWDCAVQMNDDRANKIIALCEQAVKQRVVETVLEVIEAEPENLPSSTSYQQGYVRCVRDMKAALIKRFGGE